MTTAILDVKKEEHKLDRRDAMRRARQATGKSYAAQLAEMLQLRRSIGRLRVSEYFYYRLYDDARHTPEEKRRFLGREAQRRIIAKCTDRRWWALAHDKLAFHAFMAAHGHPVPRIMATYHPYRALAPATSLRSEAELGQLLRSGAAYPFFSKPFDGMYSLGTARLDGYDPDGDVLVSSRGERVPVDAFMAGVARYAKGGYLFQEVLPPHPLVRELCGDRLATVRIVVLFGDEGPELFRALWKIPAGPHVGDNFWRSGNLLAGLDRDTGRVTRVLTGAGHEHREVERHPDTGHPLLGMSVPEWERITELCLAAARTMPGIRIQAWDIAPCEQGPVLIEVNIGGDVNLPQLSEDAGLLDEQLEAFLARCRYS